MGPIIRARKFLTNKLLNRKQMVLDVIHPDVANVKKEELKELVAKKFKVEPKNVVLYGFKTIFGGGKSTGFCLVYNSHQYLLKYEPKHRLRKLGVLTKKPTTRKAWKEMKGKIKRTSGKEISKIKHGKLQRPGDVRKLKEDYLKQYLANAGK